MSNDKVNGSKAFVAFQTAFSNRWNLFGFCGSSIIGAIPAIAIVLKKQDNDAWVLAVTLIAYSVVFMIYAAYNFHVLSNVHKDFAKTEKQKDDAVEELGRNLALNNRYDESFNALGKYRIEFESKITSFHSLNICLVDEWIAKTAELNGDLLEYLEKLCDCAVSALKARKATNDRIESNIKIIAGKVDSEFSRYALLARSSTTRKPRRDADLAPKTSYIVEMNGFFKYLTDKAAGSRYIIENDFPATLERWVAHYKHSMDEPTADALDFYKKVMCVPIMGPKYLNEDSHFKDELVNLNGGLILIGLFFIDSDSVDFNFDHDYIVVDELSINAYSAIRLYHAAVDLARKKVYGN